MKDKILALLSYGINNSKFKEVNSGGCGVFAVAINNTLAAYGINSSIVLVDQRCSESDVDDMIINMGADNINHAYTLMLDEEGKPKFDTCCSHICVELDGVLYDGEGIYNGCSISDPVHVNVMSRMNRNVNYWNSTFELRNNLYNSSLNSTGELSLAVLVREVNSYVIKEFKRVLE